MPPAPLVDTDQSAFNFQIIFRDFFFLVRRAITNTNTNYYIPMYAIPINGMLN
jgi:hypothetical protein